MKRHKILSAVAAFTAAAAMMTSVCSAESVSMLTSLTESLSLGNSEKTAQTYPTPMSNSTTSAKYKAFKAAVPEITDVQNSWYGTQLNWKPVENALLYYIYKLEGKSYKLFAKASDTNAYVEDSGTYYIRAVTYNYNDKRIFSKRSDTIEAIPDEGGYYIEDEYDSVSSVNASGGVYYEESAYADEDSGVYDDDTVTEGYNYDMPAPDNEEYTHYDADGFKKVSQTPVSTFSADVDTASYANVRRLATDGYGISPDAVRIEEMLNYFDYNYKKPEKSKFNVHYEYTDCPWNSKAKLLFMGIQTQAPAKEPNSNLVFLIDVSGSMYSKDKLPLVQESLKKLSREMTKNDRLSIVTYSGQEKVIVSGARGNMVNCISDLADSLYADGCTNGEAGINMAYDIAAKNFIKDGSNRVIMATDGDLNVGISDKNELSKFIAGKRDTGVYLTVLGFGTGNLKDDRMEALAKDGNGNYHYIDCAAEATKVLVDERVKTLVTTADDVKIQVEFNPTLVDSYKLIGYDGRKLNNEDFDNDKKDAADMGAGQSVTVMYELIPAKADSTSLTYQTSTGNKTDVCAVKIAYKEPGTSKSIKVGVKIKAAAYLKYAKTGIRFRFASCVAEAAMALRNEESYGDVSLENAKKRFAKLTEEELAVIGYSDEFASLLELLK